MADYQDKNLEELREEARARDLKGRSGLNKDELAKALEADDNSASDESSSEAPAASNEFEGEGAPRSADNDSEHYGAASEASDEDNPEVVSELSPEGQEALSEMEPKQAEFADLALDASGPLHLQSPHERVMTGAVSPEHAKEQKKILKDLPDDHVGEVTEAGGYNQPKKGSGPDGQVMPEDVIDFPPPLQEDKEDRRNAEEGKKSRTVDVATVQSEHAKEVFPDDDASGQDRAFNQRAQLYTDGLTGLADHNLPLSYRVNEVGTDTTEADDAEQEEADKEKDSKSSKSKTAAKK